MANIVRISLMDDSYQKALGWDDVIGLACKDVNIEIETSGLFTATDPKSIKIGIEVTSRLPKGGGASLATIGSPMSFDLVPTGPWATERTLFRLTKSISFLGDFVGQANDVATVVRTDGTSDAKFRDALGWTPRGIATQPTVAGASTGDENHEVPDAFALLKAAGVEVLQVAIASTFTGGIPRLVRRLIRKPCKVVYYSGHGLSWNNCLGIATGSHQYKCWANASDLQSTWNLPACQNLEYFVIAGCSLLRYRPASGAVPAETIGQEWAKLLKGKGGPLTALLGYSDAAPSDETAGDDLATEFGARIKKGITGHALVEEWLSINAMRRAWNVTGMDAAGYWWVEPRASTSWFHNHEPFDRTKDLRGPRAIP